MGITADYFSGGRGRPDRIAHGRAWGQAACAPPSISGLVDRLQRLGYVKKFLPKTDLRRKEVRLTDSGRGLVQTVLKTHGNQIAHLMGGLNPAEQHTLLRLLEKLGDHLESVAKKPSDKNAGVSFEAGTDQGADLQL
jgi:hypothetical protein